MWLHGMHSTAEDAFLQWKWEQVYYA